MIQSLLCSIDMEAILPYLNNRAEAESILGVVILGHQLDAAVTSLIMMKKQNNLLSSLRGDTQGSKGENGSSNEGGVDTSSSSTSSSSSWPSRAETNKFHRAVKPLLGRTVGLIDERSGVQLDYIASILEELKRAETSVRQYGTQNSALAKELTLHAPALAANKKHLAQVQMGICERLRLVLRLASDAGALSSVDFVKKLDGAERAVGMGMGVGEIHGTGQTAMSPPASGGSGVGEQAAAAAAGAGRRGKRSRGDGGVAVVNVGGIEGRVGAGTATKTTSEHDSSSSSSSRVGAYEQGAKSSTVLESPLLRLYQASAGNCSDDEIAAAATTTTAAAAAAATTAAAADAATTANASASTVENWSGDGMRKRSRGAGAGEEEQQQQQASASQNSLNSQGSVGVGGVGERL